MFGTDPNVNYDGIGADANAGPGIYLAELTSVVYEPAFTEEGKDIKGRIKFNFKLHNAIEKVASVSSGEGSSHTHIEYEVLSTDDNATSKSANLVKRVGHILSKYVPKEQLVQNSSTFDEYAKWVMAKLASKPYANKKVKLMVVGSVYNRKSSSRCPNYPPFIAKETDALVFDKNHTKSNAEYVAFMNSSVTDSSSADAPGFNSSPASDFV